jgi:predicted ABC-type ATPase
MIHFVNADLIAAGLSPLRPELAAFAFKGMTSGWSLPSNMTLG